MTTSDRTPVILRGTVSKINFKKTEPNEYGHDIRPILTLNDGKVVLVAHRPSLPNDPEKAIVTAKSRGGKYAPVDVGSEIEFTATTFTTKDGKVMYSSAPSKMKHMLGQSSSSGYNKGSGNSYNSSTHGIEAGHAVTNAVSILLKFAKKPEDISKESLVSLSTMIVESTRLVKDKLDKGLNSPKETTKESSSSVDDFIDDDISDDDSPSMDMGF